MWHFITILIVFQFIALDALKYLAGECNYGGRVTDDWDRRTLNTILMRGYSFDVACADEWFFDYEQEYPRPPDGDVTCFAFPYLV